jgi:hypothetical protein
MEVWSDSHPGHFTARERAFGMHWIGGWVGLRASLDVAIHCDISNYVNIIQANLMSWLFEFPLSLIWLMADAQVLGTF